MKHSIIAAGVAALALSASAHAQAAYKKDIPDSLAAKAKITEDRAAAIAQKRVPRGAIQGVELEREKGKLMYSYDFKVPGKSGIDEVNVNAITGRIIAMEHESPAAEKKEAADDAKAAKAVKAKAKKP